MPYLVDTSYFVALKVADDTNHDRAEEIFADILDGKYLDLLTLDYVLDEAVTAVRRRTRRHDLAVEVADLIANSKYVTMEYVIRDDVVAALSAYRKYKDKLLSFTDWVQVKNIESHGYSGIVSFDSDFDKVGVPRIH